MKAIALPAAFVLAAGLYASPVSAGGTDVSYKSGDETVHGIVYTPEGEGAHPGIVVIHEWWGLTDWVKDQAAELAKQGYVALAIDLYRGRVATDPEAAHELMRGLPEDRAVRDLKAAYAYLKGRKDVNGKVAVIGWCMGGGYALAMALHEPRLTATVINYGRLATDPGALGKIHGPVLGIFGGQDRGITPTDVHAFEAEMKKLGKKIDVVIYPDAGHAFENPNNKGGYRADDAADAAKRTKAFLAGALK